MSRIAAVCLFGVLISCEARPLHMDVEIQKGESFRFSSFTRNISLDSLPNVVVLQIEELKAKLVSTYPSVIGPSIVKYDQVPVETDGEFGVFFDVIIDEDWTLRYIGTVEFGPTGKITKNLDLPLDKGLALPILDIQAIAKSKEIDEKLYLRTISFFDDLKTLVWMFNKIDGDNLGLDDSDFLYLDAFSGEILVDSANPENGP